MFGIDLFYVWKTLISQRNSLSSKSLAILTPASRQKDFPTPTRSNVETDPRSESCTNFVLNQELVVSSIQGNASISLLGLRRLQLHAYRHAELTHPRSYEANRAFFNCQGTSIIYLNWNLTELIAHVYFILYVIRFDLSFFALGWCWLACKMKIGNLHCHSASSPTVLSYLWALQWVTLNQVREYQEDNIELILSLMHDNSLGVR